MDARCIFLLSGPLAVGKTAVRLELVSQHAFAYLRSSEYLRAMAKAKGLIPDRLILQDLGDSLDVATDYRWLINDVARPAIERSPEQGRWIVDAVRKTRQIEHFREAFGDAVRHIHFTASEGVLRARYEARQKVQGGAADMTTYEAAIDHDNERAARGLIECADVVINLADVSPSAAVEIILRDPRVPNF
jgi:adenylosuccinate synthase